MSRWRPRIRLVGFEELRGTGHRDSVEDRLDEIGPHMGGTPLPDAVEQFDAYRSGLDELPGGQRSDDPRVERADPVEFDEHVEPGTHRGGVLGRGDADRVEDGHRRPDRNQVPRVRVRHAAAHRQLRRRRGRFEQLADERTVRVAHVPAAHWVRAGGVDPHDL
jgi:hypothetical protein